jgi:tetratricopeptide (TPR) repeat protein
MPVLRHSLWSSVALLALTAGLAAQEPPSVQKMFESGAFQGVVERAAEGRSGNPEEIYLAAFALQRSDNLAGAVAEMQRLAEQPDEAWKAIGESGRANFEGRHEEAVAAARRATELAGDNSYAHYQLGVAAAGADDFGTAQAALARSIELRQDFAYAHYYAGRVYQRQRNLAQAAEHYQMFLRLAPDSADRAAVQAIMRTLRG